MEDNQIVEQEGTVQDVDNQEDEEQAGFDNEDLQCRFYRNEWPEVEEIVAVSEHFSIQSKYLFDRAFRYNSMKRLITELMYVYWNTRTEKL